MRGYSYEQRLEEAKRIPGEGQRAVMASLEVFRNIELKSDMPKPETVPETIRAVLLNMEHGCKPDEITAFLQECPELRNADIVFANELDDGTRRSGNRSNAAVIAEALGMNYAWGLEFIELNDPEDTKGYEGNAVFSRWPIIKAEAFYVPEAYNWYYSEQRRIGGRVSILAELDIGGERLGAVCVHLENRTSSAGRESQLRTTLARAAEFFGQIPVLCGGDCNTYAFNDLVKAEAKERFERICRGLPVQKAEEGEALFASAEALGYDYKTLNGTGILTRRKPMGDTWLPLQLDWLFAKGLTCTAHGMVSTRTEDFTWAGEQSILKHCAADQISDHNGLWCEVKR